MLNYSTDWATDGTDMCTKRLNERFEALAELLAKREALRLLHEYMQPFKDHPNFCIWINTIERSGRSLNRAIDSALTRLTYGV